MAFYDKFPYTNFQELNLDWLTQEVSKVRDNRDASDASADAALASEQAAKASETAAAASQQAAANSETAAAGSEAASAEYLEQIGTHTAGAVADWLKENLKPTTPPVDRTLTVSGAAADAKVTGDRISELNKYAITAGNVVGYGGSVLSDADNAEINTFYKLFTNESANYPDHMPVTAEGFLLTIANKMKSANTWFLCQFFFNVNYVLLYTRTKIDNNGSGTWTAWTAPDNGIINLGDILGYGEEVLTDANNAKENTIYPISTSDLTKMPANIPILMNNSYLVTLKANVKGTFLSFWHQYILDKNMNAYYVREKAAHEGSGNYSEWKKIKNSMTLSKALDEMFVMPSENLVNYNNVDYGHYINYSSGAKGTYAEWCYVIIPVTAGEVYKIASDFADDMHIAFFTSYSLELSNYVSGLLTNSGFTAPQNATYATISLAQASLPTLWINESDKYVKPAIRKILTESDVIRVESDGSGDFTKLTDALAYGMEHANTTIYLGSGDFDIIQELGSDYFKNFVYEAYTNMGPIIGNGTHLICSSKSRIICNYTGNNTEVMKGFSPFNPSAENRKGIGDYIIENATIIASNVRYCVHDDVGTQIVPYKHEYIRCNMYMDNSLRPSEGGGTSHRCLGGGLGVCGSIVIKDGIYNGAGDTDGVVVAWHNDDLPSQNPVSSIVIEGNYCAGNNTIEIVSIGTHTVKTKCLISNNSLGSDIVYKTLTLGVDNMEVIAWNNEIRKN